MNTRLVISSTALILMPILSSSAVAAEVMPNDPVLPQNNLPTNQRQNTPAAMDIPNNNPTMERRSNSNSSTNTSTGVNVGPGTQVKPKSGTQNGTLTGNGAGVGPESSADVPPGRRY